MRIERVAILAGLLIVAVAEAQIPQAKNPPVGAVTPQLTPMYNDSANISPAAGLNAYGTSGDPRPGYLVRAKQDTFGTTIMRISGDFGLPIGNGTLGVWGDRARHSYSKKQPWSMDERYYIMENRCVQVADGASCTTTAGCVGTNPIVLDGETFQPIKSIEFANDSIYDYRWVEFVGYEHWLFNLTDSGTHCFLYNIETGDTLDYRTLPFKSGGGLIGGGEGNASSRSGKYIALSSDVLNATQVAVLQIFPRAQRSIGPTFTLPPCSLLVCAPNCPIDYVSVTASGQYLDVKYECLEEHRIFPIDTATLIIGPNPLVLANTPLFCVKKTGGGYHGPNGYIGQLKHADTFLNPDDGYKDYIFGESNRCSTLTGAWIDQNWVNVGSGGAGGHYFGREAMIRLSDGRPQALTSWPSANNQMTAGRQFTWGWGSSRNVRDRDGWIFVTADTALGRRFGGEVFMLRTDSSRTVRRLGHMHANHASCYPYEPHAVPSPSGTRVVFASTWRSWCTADCRSAPTVQDYVIDMRPVSAINRIAQRRWRIAQ